MRIIYSGEKVCQLESATSTYMVLRAQSKLRGVLELERVRSQMFQEKAQPMRRSGRTFRQRPQAGEKAA